MTNRISESAGTRELRSEAKTILRGRKFNNLLTFVANSNMLHKPTKIYLPKLSESIERNIQITMILLGCGIGIFG